MANMGNTHIHCETFEESDLDVSVTCGEGPRAAAGHFVRLEADD